MGLLGCLGSRRRRGSKSKSLEAEYELLQVLGEGKTGQVVLARHRRSGAEVAVKLVPIAYLDTPARQQALRSEIDILRNVRYPSVLKLLAVFHESDRVAVVTERAVGGELLPALCDGDALGERDVARIVRELLGVLAHLHARGITHRDVKLENVLSKAGEGQRAATSSVLLIDFGLAHWSKRTSAGAGASDAAARQETTVMTGMNGTSHYMAPEMFGRNSTYGCEIDVWALGVVTFVLLFGRFPFDGRFLSQVEDKIAACDFSFPPDLAPLVTREATKFIEYLLIVNPRERPPAAMALRHPWLRKDRESTPNTPFNAYHMAQLRQFVDSRKGFT